MTYERVQVFNVLRKASIHNGVKWNSLRRASTQHLIRGINWRLYISIVTVDILSVACGLLMVWMSPVLLKLKSTDPDINPLGIPITTLQTSFLAAAPWIPSLPPAPLFIAKLSDELGRKKSLMVASVCLIASVVAVAFATNIYLYYACWFLIGIARQALFINIPIYNNEVAEPSNRGKLGLLSLLGLPIGVLYAYGFGSLTGVRAFTLICTIPIIIHLLFSYFVIESPVFLVSKGMICEALSALEKIRKHKSIAEIELEFNKIKDQLNSSKNSKASVSQLFKTRATRRAMLISGVVLGLQAMSGCVIILAFMGPIFKETGIDISENVISNVVGVVQLIVTLISSLIVEKTGKRILVLVSSGLCVIPTFLLGVYFYSQQIGYLCIADVKWLPVFCIILFIFAYSIGLGPIPLPTISELFCSELRSLAVAVNMAAESIITITLSFTYPLISELYGIYCCMWLFSACTLTGFIILYFILPETTGKSFREIQKLLDE